MKMKKQVSAIRCALLALSAATALTAVPAHAQLSAATIKGAITQDGAAVKGAVAVSAINKGNGYVYRATTNADGSYVLTGLAPGVYEIKIEGRESETVTLSIGETALLNLALPSTQATSQTVTILGSAQRAGVRNSEVGTDVTPAQMENLPQVTRNFLSFADMAPGVRFEINPQNGYASLQGGGQSSDNTNIFVDGVGQKNYVLQGGAAGMTDSQGNPFPQLAVGEYKVVTQNYKAEYDQVSSVAVSAVTKSGTNDFHGEVFADRTGSSMTAYSPFQLQNLYNSNVALPTYTQEQYGFALGGPIKEDVMHFFVAYEGKDIGTPREIVIPPGTQSLVPNAGVGATILSDAASVTEKFVENLWFFKVDTQIGEDHHVEATVRLRRESDMQPQNFNLSTPSNMIDNANDETRFDVTDDWTVGDYLNHARFSYEYFSWAPHGTSQNPEVQYFVSPTNTTNNDILVEQDGASPDLQHKSQQGLTLADDLTYTGMASHTFKGGARFKTVVLSASGSNQGVQQYSELIDNKTGAVDQVFNTENAQPDESVAFRDNQIGLYFQDDWDVTKQLELNLGLRWDYETNMLDNSFVTPADRIAMFTSQDPRTGAPLGQTYGQSLALGGVNINDYISNGHNRSNYTGEYQPRLGFSYDVNGDRSTVVFGGWGRAYDRTATQAALDELSHDVQVGGGDTFLIKNNHAMPYTDQVSFGLRQAAGRWNLEAGATSSVSRNQFNWVCGNRQPDGTWGAGTNPTDCDWGSVGSYGNLVLGNFDDEARTQTLYLKAEKPYTKVSGWQFGATYTLSNAQTTNNTWTTNNLFNWTDNRYGTPTWNPSTDVAKDRLVMSGYTDRLPYDVMISGKLTMDSGLPYQIQDCVPGFGSCIWQVGKPTPFRQFDLGLSKSFTVPKGKVVLRMDILNLFNTINYTGFSGWAGGPTAHPANYLGGDSPTLGMPSGVAGPMRTVKIGLRYSF